MTRFAPFLLLFLVAAGPRVTVSPPEDEYALLHNPDMGWVLYENYPLDTRPGGGSTIVTAPDERFEGVAAVAIMFAWSDVETAPHRYDFSKVDRAYDHWKRHGKQIQLRISTESLLWWNQHDPPAGLGVPKHVLDRIPSERKQVRREQGIEYSVVDARDPVYLECLDKFLKAVNEHFRGERSVTLIDLRGFGVWGEWHSGYRYASNADRRAALCAIIDHWAAAFPKHWLAISYSHDPDGPADYFAGPNDRFDAIFAKTYDDFLHYSAFDHAMSKPDVTLRRDGVGGAVFSNQRKLCEEAFATLAKGPMMSEFLGGYATNKVGGDKWLGFMIDDALALHSNYINLLGYQSDDALNFIKEQPKLFARGLRNMGYRLMPVSVTFPARIRADETFEIEITWVNRGVGRAMRDFRLRLSADNATCDAGALKTSQWIRGKSYPTTSRASFKSLKPGNHPLRIELIDPATDRPIALPLKGAQIGALEVQ